MQFTDFRCLLDERLLLVTLVTAFLGQLVFNAPLEVSPIISLALILGSTGLAMLVAALVAWRAESGTCAPA